MERLKKITRDIFERRIGPASWLGNFLGLVMLRLFLDKFIAKTSSPLFDFIMDIHNILFFGLTFLLVWLVLSLVLREKPFKLSYLMLLASSFIVFPPIFDLLRTGGEVFWSFYLISAPKDLGWQFLTIFGHLPTGIVYFGTKITFISAIIILSGLVFLRTRSVWKAFFSAIGTYCALFFMAAFPSILAYLGIFLTRGDFLKIKPYELIQFFSSFKILGVELEKLAYSVAYNLNFIYFLLILAILSLFFFWSEKVKFIAVLRNFRYPQLIYHGGLFFCGLGLGFLAYPQDITWEFFPFLAILGLLSSVALSWKASIIPNDLRDIEIDKLTNSSRPLPSGLFGKDEYRQFGITVFILAVLGGFLVSYQFGWLLVAYQVLAWFYSAEPMRLKRFPLIATALSALASLLILMLGFILFSPDQNLEGFPWRIFWLLFLSYTLCLPIKDFKDIPGDKRDSVWTIPVILGETKGRLVVGSAFFISYLLSVFFLNEWNLFFWSLIFGSISFWVINNKKIASWRLIWWNLAIVSVYGLILVKIVFLKS
ncbi:MAG: UbiA family prenyltransferase [Patescibacteria group bacterium]